VGLLAGLAKFIANFLNGYCFYKQGSQRNSVVYTPTKDSVTAWVNFVKGMVVFVPTSSVICFSFLLFGNWLFGNWESGIGNRELGIGNWWLVIIHILLVSLVSLVPGSLHLPSSSLFLSRCINYIQWWVDYLVCDRSISIGLTPYRFQKRLLI